MTESRFKSLAKVATQYGESSYEHYALIRSLAERIREGFCAYLGHTKPCVFLVPPQGAFEAKNYGSFAFSVAGKGFLPLEPISFGLAVRVSETADFMRLVLTASKTGHDVHVRMDRHDAHEFSLPLDDASFDHFFDYLFNHLHNWFQSRINRYDHGDYGTTDIGFDIQRVSEDS